MKLTVLSWFRIFLIEFIGKSVEVLFRLLLIILPLGIYLVLLQKRKKVSKVSSISVYTTDQSVWQHVFPGFMLVAVDPTSLDKNVASFKGKVQNWIKDNKYLIAMLFMIAIVVLILWKGM